MRILIIALMLAAPTVYAGPYMSVGGAYTDYSGAEIAEPDNWPLAVAVGIDATSGPVVLGIEYVSAMGAFGYVGLERNGYSLRVGAGDVRDKAEATGLGPAGAAKADSTASDIDASFVELSSDKWFLRYTQYVAVHDFDWAWRTGFDSSGNPIYERGTETDEVDAGVIQLGYRIRF